MRNTEDALILAGFFTMLWGFFRRRKNVAAQASAPVAGGAPLAGAGTGEPAGNITGSVGLAPGFGFDFEQFNLPTAANSFFPTAQPAAPSVPQKIPDVLSLSDARKIAKNIVDTYFRGRVDPAMLTAMMQIESSFRPSATRFEPHLNDSSFGLMQVLFSTAKWLRNELGYRAFSLSDGAAMFDPATSVYFGAAYVDWLTKHPRADGSEAWIVMSYNGGPGANNSQTRNHLAKYNAAKAAQERVK